MSTQLHSLLTRAGLSDDEAQVLLAIYRHPGSPVGRIAQYAGFKRGHTYNLISSLVGKGLASEALERGVMRVIATPPSHLPARIEKQREELTQLLLDLNGAVGQFEQLIPKLTGLPRVRVFRGAQGLKELYEFTLSAKGKVIRACADFASLFPRRRSPELNDWLWRYAEKRAKRGILYKGMVARSKESDLAFRRRRAQKRALKLLDSLPLSVEINLFDNYAAICSTDEEMLGVLIESEPLAASATNLFEAVWSRLPDYNLSGAKRRQRGRKR